jgi:L-ribulose-5-phosphate 3-epimerase
MISFKAGLNSWSLHRELPNSLSTGGCGARLSVLDLPRIAAQEFGLHALDLCEIQFANNDLARLEQLKAQLDAYEVELINISTDSFSAGEPDDARREANLAALCDWFRIAQYLGCPSVRVTTGPDKDERAYHRVAATFQEMRRTVDETGVRIAIENHGGLSDDPDAVLRLVDEFGPAHLRTVPDFGSFAPQIRLDGLRKLLPYADLVHVKMVAFGPESEQTLQDCLDIVKASGFGGYFCIEYSGPGNQHEAIRKTLELTRRYMSLPLAPAG